MKQYLALQAIKNALITIVLFGLFIEHTVVNRAKIFPQEETNPALRVVLSASVLKQFMASPYNATPCAHTS